MKNLVSLAQVKNKGYLLSSVTHDYTDHFVRSILLSQISQGTIILAQSEIRKLAVMTLNTEKRSHNKFDL